jgi:hypothetical protein
VTRGVRRTVRLGPPLPGCEPEAATASCPTRLRRLALRRGLDFEIRYLFAISAPCCTPAFAAQKDLMKKRIAVLAVCASTLTLAAAPGAFAH